MRMMIPEPDPLPTRLVSIVIPTKNNGATLRACLASIRQQTYPNIEVILVDGHSADATHSVATAYAVRLMPFDPKLPPGTFDAPHRRNYGAAHAKGAFIYYVDADMELGPSVVADAVALCAQGYAAVVIPEESFGEGIWARAKALERRCYLGDDNVEAPRFILREAWDAIGGLDETLRGGGDDWDLAQTLKERGFRIARSHTLVRHNEGRLTLSRLARKRFMYGRDALRYVAKRPRAAVASYFPLRRGYLRHWRDFARHPYIAACIVIMRSVEYGAGGLGLMYSLWRREGKS